jgi:hypothetical protein
MKVRVQRVLYFGTVHFVGASHKTPLFIVTILFQVVELKFCTGKFMV